VIDRTAKPTLLFSPTPACRCSSVHTCMWNRRNWVLHATTTSWPDLQCTTAPPSGLCMALCTPRPLLRSLEDMCNDRVLRVSSPALTSDQPLEYKKKEKTKYSYTGWKHLGLVWMKTFRPCLDWCVSTTCVKVDWNGT
jgi:hypothetical protein